MNSASHWFSLRKIKGVWYNLDSLLYFCPEIVDEAMVKTFLSGVTEFGFNIFAVKGNFPGKIVQD